MNGERSDVHTFGERAVYTTHSSHCGGGCLLKAYVRDGVVTRMETDDGDSPQFRACARGRAYRQRMYGGPV